MAAYKATRWRLASSRRLGPKNVILLVGLLLLFLIPGLLTIPTAKAVTTTNCTNTNGVPTATCTQSAGGAANGYAMQRKVFFANGNWWIFFGATVSGVTGIFYQSCPATGPTSCDSPLTGSAWTTPALFTAGSANVDGWLFDAVLGSAGNNLFYVAAAATAVQTFVWGEVNLPANGVITAASYSVQDASFSFSSLSVYAWAQDRASIGIDGSGDLWIAIVTASTNGGAAPWYETVFECTSNVNTSPTGCTGASAPWSSTKFQLTGAGNVNANYISPPSLLPTSVSGTNYMSLAYIDLSGLGTGGTFDIYTAQADTVSSGAISWTTPCGGTAAAPTACQAPAGASGGTGSSYSTGNAGGGAWYSAISSGTTIYVDVVVSGTEMVSFAYVVGTGFPTGTYVGWAALDYAPSISVSGTNAVVSFYNGGTGAYVFYWEPLADVSGGVDGWAGPTDLALNTEFGVGGGDASPYSYTVGSYSLIGVFWNDNIGNPAPATNRIRFAVISMSNAGVVNFPVSLTLSYYEYTNPVSTNFAVSPSNYFTVTYTVCNEAGCTGPGVAQYTSNSGAPLTIANVQSYSEWFVTDQTAASTNGEKWCLLYGSNCGGTSGYGASDGLTQSWYYYDQLSQPNLYAIASPALFSLWTTGSASVATVNYDTATTNTQGFSVYPNTATTTPWILPRASIYDTGAVDESVQYVRSRDVVPGCTGQTIYPDSSGSTCAPSTSIGTLTTVPVNVNYPTVTTLPSGVVEYVPIAITNSQASPTPSNFQQMITVDSASFEPYEASNLQNIEFFTNAGAIIPSWLESGGLNTSPSSVYWLNLGTNTIAAGATLTVYMGFGSPTTANFFTTPTGKTGEAPTLSPSYGEYDNGAVVFAAYWNFAGTSLPTGWTSTFYTGTESSATTTVLTVNPSPTWVANQWQNDYLQYTSGTDSGDSLIISSNTANTITTAAFPQVPTAGASFIITSGSGYIIDNGVTFTGTGPSVIETTAANYADTAITEVNYQVPNTVNYGGVMLVTSSSGQYTYAGWQTLGVGAGEADNGFDIDVYNGGNNFRSFSGGAATSIPVTVTPGTRSYVGGGTVNGGDTIEYVNEIPSESSAYITAHVPAAGNYYIAAGDLASQYFSFNWIRQRAYPPSGVMPTVNVGPATIASPTPSATQVLAYAPVTLTNSQTVVTPPYFQADVNVTSNSPAYFSGTSTSAVASPGTSGISTAGTTNAVLQDSGATWTVNQWQGYSLEYVSGPAAGETVPIASNTANTITTTVAFNPAPDASGDGFKILPITTLTDSSAGWTPNAYVGDYLEYTSGPAAGDWLQITANTATTLVTVSPKPAPTAGGGDNFLINNGFEKYEASTLQNVEFFVCPASCATSATVIPSWLESGESNTSPTSVYWLNLPSSIAASGGTLTVYMGFTSTAVNLFSSTGYTGETATQGPSYGIYDNGAIVFNFYDNFAGSTLSAQWSPTSTISTGESLAAAIGQLGTTTGYQNEGVSTVSQFDLLNPSYSVFDSSGDLWVVDSSYNRVVEYVPGTSPCAAGQFCNGMAATVVIGQPSFGTGGVNQGGLSASTLSNPRGIAFDSSGNLWVADTGNNRILEFTPPFTTGEAASLVIGQASFTANGANGVGAIGTAPYGSEDLSSPRAITFDSSGNMWVADSGNNRVLKYVSPFTTEMGASLALGQASLDANGAATTAAGESAPSALAFDGANLWVVDTNNNRVLEYASAFSTGESATVELGQAAGTTAFTTAQGNQNLAFPTAQSLIDPSGIGVDSSGNIYIADTGNNRILEFTGPFSNDQAATGVFGQSSFTTDGVSTSASGADMPRGVTFDSSGNMWITDTGNNRVDKIVKGAGFTNGEAATLVLGQPSFSLTPNPLNLYDPTDEAFDSKGDLWVVDSGNNRILEYPTNSYEFYTGESATVVLGQTSLAGNGAGNGAAQLNDPTYIAFDSSGNLWVSDTGNNRILEFAAPFKSGESATTVIGQAAFGSGGAATTASGLKSPEEIAFDSSGDLWVADSGNSRVLEYAAPLSTGESATTVLGQTSFTSGTANSSPAFTGSVTAGSTTTVLQDTGASWSLNQWAGASLTYTSGPDAGQTLFITSNTATTITTTVAFTLTPATGNTFSIGPSSTSLNTPYGVAFNQGDLYVSDTGNNRILEYLPAFTNGEAASMVLGQILFTTNAAASSATGLREPTGLTFDYWNDLWVADTGNNRVVQYEPQYNSLFSGESINTYEGQGGSSTGYAPNGQGSVTAATLNYPTGVAFDSLGNLWIADTGNNRVGASALGTMTINDGVTIRQTSNWMGIIARPTINLQTNILEFYGYMSSPNSQNQIFGTNTPATNTPTPTPNSLYDFGTRNFNAQNWYDQYNAASASYNDLANLNIPGTAPTVTWVYTESDCTGYPIEYPATTVTCGGTQSASTTTTVYWGLRNSTVIMVNDIPGNPDQRWAASANLLGWTLYSSFSMEPAVPYYLQYGNTFLVQAGGKVSSLAPGITFVLYGTQYGVQYTPIVTLSSTVPSATIYVDAGTVVIMPATGSGAASGTRWENSDNQSQTVVVGDTNPNTVGGCTTLCTATYFEQFQQYLEYVTKDGSSLPASAAPEITFESFGLQYNVLIPSSTRTIWIDALTPANITSLVLGTTPYERWTVPTSAWTITCSNTGPGCSNEIPAPAIIYYHQFEQQLLNYKTSDYNQPTSPTQSQISYTSDGSPASANLYFTGGFETGTAASGSTTTVLNAVTNPVSAAITSGTAQVLTDSSATWGADQWTGYWLTYTSGPDNGDSLQILSNTATTITTATAFPSTPGAGNTFTITTGWTKNEWVGYTLIYTSGPDSGQSEVITASSAAGTITTTVPFNSAPSSGNSYEILNLVWMDAATTATINTLCVTGNPAPCTTPPSGGGVEQWVPDSGDGSSGTWTITGSNCAGTTCLTDNAGVGIYGTLPSAGHGNASVLYDDQLWVSYETFPPGSPSPPSTIPYPLEIESCPELTTSWCQLGGPYTIQTLGYPPQPYSTWQTTPFSVREVGNASYTGLGFFTGTPNYVCYEPSYAPPCAPGGTTASANSLVILTATGSTSWDIYANFELQEGITFEQTGIPVGEAQWVVTVSCDTTGGCNGASGSYADGAVVKQGASSSSALLIPNLPYATYSYVVDYPTENAAGNIRWLSTPGYELCTNTPSACTTTLDSANPSQNVLITFSPQYLLSANSNPAWTSNIEVVGLSIDNGTTPTALTCDMAMSPPSGTGCNQYSLQAWLLPGSSGTLEANVNPALFTTLGVAAPAWQQWTGTGCSIGTPGCLNQDSLAVSVASGAGAAPVAETANFYVSMVPQVIPSSDQINTGGTVTPTVYLFGGIGTGTVNITPAALPPGVTVNFYICDPLCGAPSPNTISFPTSTEAPLGAAIEMQISVAASSPAFGPYHITITTQYEWAPGDVSGVCGTAGQPACPVFILDIFTPQAETVGPSNAYGITTPGQTALTYANGYWLSFYFGQNSLVYNYSSTGTTWEDGGVVPDGLVPATTPATPSTVGTTATKLVDASADWTANQWVGYYLTYTDGPSCVPECQSLLVLSNTQTTITTVSAFSPAPTPGGGDTFALSDGGVHGYSFAVTSLGNTIYYVLSSSNNNTIGQAKPGNYFYWNYGTVQADGLIVWNQAGGADSPDNAVEQALCPPVQPSCPLFGAGQPSILITNSGGNNYLNVALPVLTKVNGESLWLIQFWQSQLGLSGAPGAWSDGLDPTVLPSTVPGIPARSNGPDPTTTTPASSVIVKLLALSNGEVALTDWVGNDISTPSVEIFTPSIGFTQWSGQSGFNEYSCTPVSSGVATPDDYVLYGQQSDAVASGDIIYFAGQNAEAPSLTDPNFGSVVYFSFLVNPVGTSCGAPGVPGTSGYNAVTVVAGGGETVPSSPVPGQPWHVALAYGGGSLTLGFGEQNFLGTALGSCNSNGICTWVVLPASVEGVAGLIDGLTSAYSNISGNTGSVWVETSPTSPTGYIVAFALI